MFGWEFPPHNSGGLGVACFGLTRALSRLGAEITFVLPSNIQTNVDYMKVILAKEKMNQQVGVKIFSSPLHPYATAESYCQKLEMMDENSTIYADDLQSEVLRYAIEAKEIALGENFDIIHAHDWLTFLAGIAAKKVSQKPLVIHVHSTEYDRSGGGNCNQFVFEIEKRGMEEADKIIAISQHTKNTLVSKYQVDPSKIEVIHNGVDQDKNEMIVREDGVLSQLKKSGKFIVFFLGRLTIQKGVDYFLKMAQKVLEKRKDVVFVVAGSGDMERQLIMLAADLGISDKVFFVGFLRGDQANEMFSMGDLFVMPSISEPFGLVALESMLHETPVIVSKQSGVCETVSHALKVDFWDVDEMANKTLSVLSHASLKTQLSDFGKNEALKLDWNRSAQKVLRLFQQLIKV